MSITVDWNAIEAYVTQIAAGAVNATAVRVATEAQRLAPVRKIFAGGHVKKRFMTAAEVRDNIKRAGLAPGDMIAAPPTRVRGKFTTPTYSRKAFRNTGYATVVVSTSRVHAFKPSLPGMGKGDWRQIHQNEGGQWKMMSPEAEHQLTIRGASYLKTGDAQSVSTGEEGFKERPPGPVREMPAPLPDGSTPKQKAARSADMKAWLHEAKANELATKAYQERMDKATSSAEVRRLGGSLRGSIVALPAGTTGRLIEANVQAGGGGVDYQGFMEFGSRHAAAHPYLRPALKKGEEILRAELKKAGLRP